MKPAATMSANEALHTFFPKVDGFRDCQKEAIERTLHGRSSLVLMPTGMGKSLTYQVPVFAMRGIGIVLSPLIVLMEQQAQLLRNAGANVLSLGGADSSEAIRSLLKFPWSEGSGFLFVSPERAETDGYLEYLIRRNKQFIRLVAIDESHCISQWGHDFRPPYKSLPGMLDRCFGRDSWPAVLCLTATLDVNSQREILRDFRLAKTDVVRSPNMLRSNLELSFAVYDDFEAKRDALAEILANHRGEKVIVYTHRKKSQTQSTRALSNYYAELGHSCAPFDADLPMEKKDETLTRFANGDVKVVFATGAFGMGVDIPDVRGVVHFLLPESIEQYYQEVGRAGRDGKPAFGVLLYTKVNSKVRRDMIAKARRSVEDVRKVWDEVCNVAENALKTISPYSQFQGRDDEYALFYAFQRIGALEVLCRGPGRFSCFEARGPDGAKLLQRLGSVTKTGMVSIAVRKAGLDPIETVESLHELCHRGELKLVKSPDKTLFFRTREVLDKEVQQITDEINERIDAKLESFDAFVALVEAGADPTSTLKARFDSSPK